METRTYTRHELQELIASDFFARLESIPISPHRAVSQINNPRAADTDVLLVVQYDDGKMVGYLGILPDYLFIDDKKEKVGWLTCFWVDDAYKSKNVAANLFLRVIRAWEQKILITNIVPWLEPVYQKTKIFLPTVYKTGFRGYVRSNLSELLPPKKVLFKKITPLLRLTDFFLNLLGDIRLLMFRKYDISNIQCQYLSVIDDRTARFISEHNHNNWNRRGSEEINWIISYPWIMQRKEPDEMDRKYYFSSFSKQFFNRIFCVKNNEQIEAVCFLTIRDKKLTVPYLFCTPAACETVGKIIINTLLELKLNMVTTFNSELALVLKNIRTPFFFSKDIKKPYLISKRFDSMQTLKFQDGDGDCAFY